jgi:Spx/MgsR family transcriptional regulator
MTILTVYGIKNCNTVKTTLDWLKKNKIEFEFYDYKTKSIDEHKLKDWCKQVGWEGLVNKRGTTWRQLEEKVQISIKNEKSAIALMLDKTSVIKRPLLEKDGKIIALGFDDVDYKGIFKVGR